MNIFDKAPPDRMGASRKMTRRKRRQLFERWREQGGRCIWCGRMTWITWMETEAEARVRFGSLRTGKRHMFDATATREHIIPLSLGGADGLQNIACACQSCNRDRDDDPTALPPHDAVVIRLPESVQDLIIAVFQDAFDQDADAHSR